MKEDKRAHRAACEGRVILKGLWPSSQVCLRLDELQGQIAGTAIR